MNRREFLRVSGSLAALSASGDLSQALAPETAVIGSVLPPWQPGFLDIHHINTGRGNSALAMMPDGTSLLIDAGASGTQGPAMNSARPDASRRPGQWIARYIERQLKPLSKTGLDYALLSHLHGDHIGDVMPQSPDSTYGEYKLTGISDVAEVMPIGKLIDRGYPDYAYPTGITDATGLNYIQFARNAAGRGLAVEKIQVGSSTQITPLHGRERYPEFRIRVIAGNGRVWTGEGETSVARFPPRNGAGADQVASENSCSIALRIGYGRFSYFTGGDLTCDTNYGRDPCGISKRQRQRPLDQSVSRPAIITVILTRMGRNWFVPCVPGSGYCKVGTPRTLLCRCWLICTARCSIRDRAMSSV